MILLDLYCGCGGASVGYRRAGFEKIVGIDNVQQRNYPYEFILGDALDRSIWPAADVVHASPPCQRWSALNRVHQNDYPDLITPTRALLQETDSIWVIENVPGSPLRDPVMLCGSMFGLGTGGRQLRRHRLFESNVKLSAPGPCQHAGQAIGVYGHGRWDNKNSDRRGGYQGSAEEKREAMDITWANRDEIAQAIPPAYTEFLGAQIRDMVSDLNRTKESNAGADGQADAGTREDL